MGWSSKRCFPSAVQGAAAKMAGAILPPAVGGETMTMFLQPASFAGMAFIKTVDG